MENIHLKRFQENQRKVRRPKNFRQSKSVDENSGGIRFSLQRWKPFYQRHYLRGKDFFTASELCFSWSAAPSWCATLPRTSSTSTISSAWLSRWGAWEAWFLLKAQCTTPLPYPIWASLLTVVSHLLLIVNASSNTLIYFLKVRRTTVFPSFFQSFQGVSLRIPSSDLASWNTFWVALLLLSIPKSRLFKRLKDSLNNKKDFSGWGERNCCERVQEAKSFRPC